jgi:hypothetical protein
MTQSQEMLTDCLEISQSIDYLSRSQAREFLELSNSSLSRYQTYINEVVSSLDKKDRESVKWSYVRNQRGFTRRHLLVLAIFKGLVKKMGIDQARLSLSEQLREVFDGN